MIGMNLTLTTAAVSLILGATSTWYIQSWRYDSQIAQLKQTHAAEVQTFKSALGERNTERVANHLDLTLKAKEDADKQARKTSAVVASNRTVAASLRCPSPAGVSNSGQQAPAVASIESTAATAQPDVLGACAASITVLAEWCDGHVRDLEVIQRVSCGSEGSTSDSGFCSSSD